VSAVIGTTVLQAGRGIKQVMRHLDPTAPGARSKGTTKAHFRGVKMRSRIWGKNEGRFSAISNGLRRGDFSPANLPVDAPERPVEFANIHMSAAA
jgi:hypothetical protein